MTENDSASIEQVEGEVPLAPMLAKLRSDLRLSRKKLLKDKGNGGKPVFADPEQLRQFIAQFLYPQMITIYETLGPALNDTYALAASNAEDVHRLRRRVNEELGREVDDGGATMETVQEIVAAMHVLGAIIQKRFPDNTDAEIEAAYNGVSAKIDKLLEEMTESDDDEYDDDDDEYDDDDDEDDDGDDEDEQPSESKPPKPAEASAEKKPDEKP